LSVTATNCEFHGRIDGGFNALMNLRMPSNAIATQSINKFPFPFLERGIPRVARYVNTRKNQMKNSKESHVGNVPMTRSSQIE
jgi:hypothetical protein